MSNLKVEGKVGDFCLKCKNCKAVTRIHDGKNASIRIIEVNCEDPYDGMVKTLDVDSDICCSMFEPNSPCDKISLRMLGGDELDICACREVMKSLINGEEAIKED